METKICKICEVEKELSHFTKHKTDGYRLICKHCVNAARKEKRKTWSLEKIKLENERSKIWSGKNSNKKKKRKKSGMKIIK